MSPLWRPDIPSIPSCEITPEGIYLRRRDFLAGGAAAATSLTFALAGCKPKPVVPTEPALTGVAPGPFGTDEPRTSYKDITTYNNFYELGVDQFFDFAAIGKDIVKRKFITVGFAAFLLLIPLAITSTDGMLRRLGFVRWKRLHRLIYLAAALGVVHFVWRVKSDLRQPVIFGAALAVLLVIRALRSTRAPTSPRHS